jgi:probable phosphoglycerate mutase
MTLLALLRHADTAWSVEGRIQGHSDVPLSESGRGQLRGRALPQDCIGMKVVTSPLARCVETAALLGAPQAEREPRIAEMRWGAWEGRRLEDLRRSLGAAMRENEDRGLDFRPEGGESPREVLSRVSQWILSLEESTLAITHRGVIRVVLAQATGWDMLGKPPVKLDWDAVHLFRIEGGRPRIDKLNLK